MNLNVKRLIAGLCCTVMIAGSLCGCGEKKEEASDGLTEVKIWASDKGAKAAMVELVNEYNETTGKQKGIRINYEMLTGDFNQQLDLSLESGSAADIFVTSKLEAQAMQGYLQPINDLEGGEEFLKHFSDRYNLKGLSYEDKVYSVPNKALTVGLVYNKDMFKAAGLVDENGEATPPETYEELREYAKILTNKEKKQYGIIFPGKSGTWYPYEIEFPMMSSVGHDGFDPVAEKYDYSGLKPIMEAIMGIKEDGSCYPGTESVDADPARARFAEGSIGMKFAMSWDVGVFTDQFPAKFDWGVAPVPVVDKDNKYKQKMAVYKGFCMGKIPEDKDADKIFEVYKWLCGDELQVALYEREINLPWDFSIIEGKEFDDLSEQWIAFGDLLEISTVPPTGIRSDTTGEPSLADMFLSDVWNGSADAIEGILNRRTEALNKGIEKYKKNNPDYVPDPERNKSYDPTR